MRTDPQAAAFDIFSVNPDGSGVRRLTTNREGDRQPDWSPSGGAIGYTIDKPASAAKLRGRADDGERDAASPADDDRDRSGLQPAGMAARRQRGAFRRSGPTIRVGSIWQMGPRGERPALRFSPPAPPLYPSLPPNAGRVLFAAILSPTGDTDRGIFSLNADGSRYTTLFDVPAPTTRLRRGDAGRRSLVAFLYRR